MEADYSPFLITDGNEIIILILHVDSLLLTCSNPNQINHLKQQLLERFEMTDLRDVALYLGVQFIRTPNAIFLMQKSYCLQILKEFDMLECSPATVPMTEDSD